MLSHETYDFQEITHGADYNKSFPVHCHRGQDWTDLHPLNFVKVVRRGCSEIRE